MKITKDIVKELINEQYPRWNDLDIKEVEKNGHDNRTFHLGNEMLVRLPSGKDYAMQIEKEIKWLPILKDYVSLKIPVPVVKGNPSKIYPFSWSVNKWIEGDTLNYDNIKDINSLARDLAQFLKELQAIDAKEGPIAGKHNFYRGGALSVYDEETRGALIKLSKIFPKVTLEKLWNEALESKWNKKAVWVHGDIAVGNLLIKDGSLCAVIDFGILGTGDPACDYVMAWTFFDEASREVFKNNLKCDEATWKRAKGWALWKALISYDINNEASEISQWAKRTIRELIDEEFKTK